MQNAFGSGQFWSVGAAPVRFGGVQGVQIGFKGNVKTLHGSDQYPIAVGRGATSIDGKCTYGVLSGKALNDLFFNNTITTGQTVAANQESGTISGSPKTVTVSNSATFVADLGVRDAATGTPFVRVASSPAAGQYTVASGVYTFNSSEPVTKVKIDYTYTASSSGQTLTISQIPMGAAPTFTATLQQIFKANTTTLQLNACTAYDLAYNTQLEDFVKPDISFGAFADASNTIGIWSFSEVA